jgi:tetratricopeptide (TPR) repeat protein
MQMKFTALKKNPNHKNIIPLVLAALGCAVLLTVNTPAGLAIQEAYERAALTVAPSGTRAFAYGERHFDAQNPSEYDVNRAYALFVQALKLDPTLAYVHHEIARIHFLRGDFGDALAQIDIQIEQHGDSTANSYYVRALIEGYMGDYADSANDYAHFLQFDPHDWAGLNDYAWVLLKAGRFADAASTTAAGLQDFPDNPWLLNSNAIALYEEGHIAEAQLPAQQAAAAAAALSEADWLHAYPGNDPKIAADGLAAFRTATAANIHMIDAALASSTVE